MFYSLKILTPRATAATGFSWRFEYEQCTIPECCMQLLAPVWASNWQLWNVSVLHFAPVSILNSTFSLEFLALLPIYLWCGHQVELCLCSRFHHCLMVHAFGQQSQCWLHVYCTLLPSGLVCGNMSRLSLMLGTCLDSTWAAGLFRSWCRPSVGWSLHVFNRWGYLWMTSSCLVRKILVYLILLISENLRLWLFSFASGIFRIAEEVLLL